LVRPKNNREIARVVPRQVSDTNCDRLWFFLAVPAAIGGGAPGSKVTLSALARAGSGAQD
jgi:hypothetical protein